MAKQTLTTIKNWFRTRLKPTQAQYWDTWDSFWHKDETIPVSSIEELEDILMSKPSTEGVTNIINESLDVYDSQRNYGYWLLKCGLKDAVKLGYLYKPAIAQDARGIVNTASADWRIASYADCDYMIAYGGETAGGKLKETGIANWNSPNLAATNEFNFNGLGVGIRDEVGTFFHGKNICYMMSADTNTDAWGNRSFGLALNYNTAWASHVSMGFSGDAWARKGYSIRLCRDVTEADALLNDGEFAGYYVGFDGKIYGSVRIGDLIWTSESLAETKFSNGDDVPNITDGATWAASVDAVMCAFENNEANVSGLVDHVHQVQRHGLVEIAVGAGLDVTMDAAGKITITLTP